MNSKTLDLLEYGKILDMLMKEATTEIGKKMALALRPGTWQDAQKNQRLGLELKEILSKTSSPGLTLVKDVRAKVSAASQGISLQGKDLWDISEALRAFEAVLNWTSQLDGSFTEIHRVRKDIPELTRLREKLDGAIDSEGLVKDSATSRLFSLRRSIREFQDKLRKRAEEIARGRVSTYLQDSIVTIRNGRYVIPVKQEHASKILGIVHDQSGSGQTLFVEPQELVEMGNNLRKMELLERDEVERILSEISSMVGDNGQGIIQGLVALGEFDLNLAKIRLLSKWKGSFPNLSPKHEISLVKAWHPLLKGDPVPIDLRLSEDEIRTVVITGPNMGGKTVALKTLGLLTSMALSGLPCPCREETVIGDIQDILADIGDEQSIEENLSTFSAHMTNVRRILEEAGPGQLVLIDELGQGTDPEEGCALAIAILQEIHEKKALTCVTSHFSQMKILAGKTWGMENASVEWDAVNMVPTYRLIVGKPGRSNAFLVAKRLGIASGVLDKARSNMQEELVHLDQVVQEMEEATQRARMETQKTFEEKEALRRERENYERKLEELREKEKEIVTRAKREAESLLTRARVEFEKALREIRSKEKDEREKAIPKIRERLSELKDEVRLETMEEEGRFVPKDKAVPGLRVKVLGFSGNGVIADPPNEEGELTVQMGPIRVRTKMDQLRYPSDEREQEMEGAPSPRQASALLSLDLGKTVSHEVDLRGLSKEEACLTLDKYLDDAFLAGLSQVRVIHGKGTGALREAVEEYLKSLGPRIADFRLGDPQEGGSGVTVIKLK